MQIAKYFISETRARGKIKKSELITQLLLFFSTEGAIVLMLGSDFLGITLSK